MKFCFEILIKGGILSVSTQIALRGGYMEFLNIYNLLDIDLDKHRPLAFFGVKAHKSHESIRDWVKWQETRLSRIQYDNSD